MSNHEQETKEHQLHEREYLVRIHTRQEELIKRFDKFEEKATPVIEWFENITFTKRLIMWTLGFLSAVGGLILMWIQIFKE